MSNTDKDKNRLKAKALGGSNVFSGSYQSQAQRQDRSYFKRLYNFNANVELAEFSLPFEMSSAAQEGAKKSSSQRPKPLDDEKAIAAKMQAEYDAQMSGHGRQVLYDMDGNEILEDEYGQEMDGAMEEGYGQEEYGEEQDEDDLRYEEFEALIEKQEDESSNKIAELRAANYVGSKGTPMWHLRNSIKTGEQAISFFAKYGSNMPIKFLNCNRKEVSLAEFRPYDLVITPSQDPKELNQEYFTISAQGVVQVFQDKSAHIKGKKKNHVPTEFLSLPEWMQQCTMFNVLTSMKFFKHYLIGKVFRLWKGNVRYRMYNRTRQDLSKNLIFARPDFLQEFMGINKTLYEMQSKLTFQVEKKAQPFELEIFMQQQRNHHDDAKTHYRTKVDEEIKNCLVQLTKKIGDSRTLREEEDLENSKKGKAEKKKSIVLQKEERNLKNQVLHLARNNYKSLGTFIRLIDYRVVEAQVRINQESADFIFNEMENGPQKYAITTSVDFDNDFGMSFQPDKSQFKTSIDKLLLDMKSAVEDIQPINLHSDLQQYINGLITDTAPRFSIIVDDSYRYKQIKRSIEDTLTDDFTYLEEETKKFELCRSVHVFETQFRFEDFKAAEDSNNLEVIKQAFEKYSAWEKLITNNIQQYINKGLLRADGKKLRDTLQTKVKKEQNNLRGHLSSIAEGVGKQIQKDMEKINDDLKRGVQNLETYVLFMRGLKQAEQGLKNCEESKIKLEQMKVLLQKNRDKENTGTLTGNTATQLQHKIEGITQELERLALELTTAQDKAKIHRDANVALLEQEINKQKGLITEQIDALDSEVLTKPDVASQTALQELGRIKKRYDACNNKIKDYQEYEEVIELAHSPITEVEIFDTRFNKRETLWRSRYTFNEAIKKWYYDPLQGLDAEATCKEILGYQAQNIQMKMKMKKGEKDEVLDTFDREVNDVVAHVELIRALGCKDLAPRHWKKIFAQMDTTNIELRDMTLQRMLDDHAMDHQEYIQEQASNAKGEAELEREMDEVKGRWAVREFAVFNYRESKDRFIIKEVEDVITELEDDIMTVSAMMGSRFVNEIRQEVEEWERRLGYISDTIDEWLTFQRQWMYLENIFNAEDIQTQLKAETKQFQAVDKFWKDHMLKAKKDAKVMSQYDSGAILKKFQENNKKLEEIQKGLEDYLGTKRAAFPRFYFLSNDDLIEILSQTRNVHAVQPHLMKCFDSIKKIEFTKESNSKEIIGMWSPENEYVDFTYSVMAEGPVEHWLLQIQYMMCQSLFDQTKTSFKTYPADVTKRDEWLFNFPAQPILTMDMVMWTKGVTDAITEIQSGLSQSALKEWLQKTNLQLEAMIKLVRGELTPLQRSTLGALMVLDVHAQFITEQMIKSQLSNINDFLWTSQLRYYWEKLTDLDGDPYKGDDADYDAFCKQTNTRFRYAYEYLGNGPRLVITPLTDKCYMTLTGALHSNYGGNPQGPAGTGKTETTKDLAKALAVQCVVFNCGDGLDVRMMARFFTGLASGGAWSCFDEFNRIFIEVLSVIAQQILTIQSAVKERKQEFFFDDKQIPLNLRFGVFITMNPGYAGRTELPDNLNALFRPISMMIPDYALISQIYLFADGFANAIDLSKKMVKLYSLSSEQLSKQDHYDFGMRAVKSVLVMAGKLRRKEPDAPEDQLLIRAMRDSNVPKFLEHDLPLFEGIITDLFPTSKQPVIDNSLLEKAIQKCLAAEKLQFVDGIRKKIIQLLETMTVRHGNMIVGSTGTGKTTCSRILGKALKTLYDDGHKDDFYKPVDIQTLNPKAVRMGELFGETNIFTAEWKEGIVSKLVKDAVAEMEGSNSHWKRWICFDGPVDALWIENMNTVLDDNKMLCLNNGQRIRMPDTCTMLFEVNDLKVASPATVSRCGMVFLEPIHLGWQCLIQTWFEKQSEHNSIHPDQLPRIRDMVINYLQKLIVKVNTMKQAIQAEMSNLVASCLRLIQIFLNKEAIKLDDKDIDADRVVNNYVAFCVIWSVGANIHDADRNKFGVYFKQQVTQYQTDFLTELDVFEQGIDTKTHKFQKWDEQITEHYCFDEKQNFFEILVPTNDTVKYKFLLQSILMNNFNALIMGETGVGKSVITKNFLMNAPENLLSAFINFSGKTSTTNLMDAIEGNLDAPRRTLLQPKAGKKMVFFIDDVNMPQLDRYGSQPPCELLRQIIDQGGYYDVDKLVLKIVNKTNFVTACAPPSGGRNPVSPRLFRHFNMLWVPDLSSQSMKQIFSQILKGYLLSKGDNPLASLADLIIKASVEIYTKVIAEFLPTPTKCHYTFNLRDLSKVVQGMLMCELEDIQDKEYLIKLYMCETYRVFRDRLIDDVDRKKFSTDSHNILEDQLNLEWELASFENVQFGDFESGEARYTMLGTTAELLPRLTTLLEYYNASRTPMMNLVFFSDCIQHLARIGRILRQQRGNAMLVGVGGSGRRSMAMFAASFNRMATFQIEITKTYSEKDWHENIRTLLKQCALEDQTTQFLFSDTQIVFESFLEDINNLLNSGEIPNLFAPDEKQMINDELTEKAKAAKIPLTREAVYAYFVQLCRERMHLVLAFSPVGDSFRNRCRQFPSIINCATIDWYNSWPEDALYSVAHRKYEEKADELDIRQDLDVLSKASVQLHLSTQEESMAYYQELRRNNYVTPTSYLALVKVFITELKNQRDKIPVQIQKYKNGLQRLEATNVIVEQLQKDLEVLKPEIAQKEQATQEMVIVLQEKDKIAKEKEKVTAAEAAEAAVIFNSVKRLKDECDAELSVALPALEKAIKALDTLKESDIGEMKGYAKPPEDLVLVMDAVALLLGENAGWDSAKKIMGQPKAFIKRLKDFDKDNIKETKLKKLKKFINDERFDPVKIKAKSTAGMSICQWCCAMDKYSEVNKVVIPKKIALAEAEGKLATVKKELDKKEAALREIKAELSRLQSDYSKAQQQLDQLSRDKKKIELQLERASKLVSGLADESTRWKLSIQELNEDKRNMLGNTVLAAGFLAYVGCFTFEYRRRLLRNWQKFLKSQNMAYSHDWSLQKILGDSLKIRTWNIQGLPADDLSIDNGIITTYPDSRWPLIIDPQTQGNRWIKNKEKDNSLKVIKLSTNKFLVQIESAIKMGFSVLLENIGETLDPSLEPVLQKNLIKKGTQQLINLGGSEINYHIDFQFFLTTKLPNPHYLPEICIKVTLLNFTVTPQGLEDQLLVEVIKIERPELELQKDNNIISLADCNRQLKDTETRILKLVSEAGEDILEDEELILTLDQSKQTAIAIGERKAEAEVTAEKINVSREGYRPVATRGSVLYFVIANLSLINDMYQYSLEFFVRLFRLRLEKSEASDELERRLIILIDDITKSFYLSICRGLFERDKLLYSFLNTAQILIRSKKISQEEWNCILRGSPNNHKDKENKSDFLDAKQWVGLWGLQECHENFANIIDSIKDVGDKPIWKEVIKSESPWQVDLPAVFEARLTHFQKTMLINVLKTTKLMGSVKEFVRNEMGPFYIESPPFDLEGCLEDSTNVTPIIFVLSPGADPIAYLKNLAVAKGMDKKLESISLGQGQDVIAEKMIEEGQRAGNWVCLQNCHLFTSWMPKLEVIQEKMEGSGMHPEYRLWLTSNPSPSFPVPVLQNGNKITNEPPRGLKAGITRTFTDLGKARYEEDFSKGFQYRKLVFALAFFHSVILERRKYGPIGWNVTYQWMNSDFNISEQQLLQYLKSQDQVPYVALNYLVAQVNYGGRVTDKQDVRCMNAMLKKYFCAEIMQEGYKFSMLDNYFAPPDGSFEQCLDYIATLPLDESPEVFGLHSNANISYDTQLVQTFIDTILLMQPRVSGGKSAITPEQIVNNKVLDYMEKLPEIMDWNDAHPETKRENKPGVMISLGVFVRQEMERFNKLLQEVKRNLKSLENAIKGTEVMSSKLENIFNSFMDNKVPESWMDSNIGFLSLKPLDSWIKDFVERIAFIGSWVKNGPPHTYRLAAFFFPQGFMTASMQTYARATGKPIDTLGFQTNVLEIHSHEVTEAPEIGVNIHGLYMQGAKWDYKKKCVQDSDPKVPLVEFPVIWLEPMEMASDLQLSPSKNFECPLYKTSARKGELMTTGHSTNFVLMLNLPSLVHQDFWIRRGTALLCMTDD